MYHPALKVSSDRTEPNRLIQEITPLSIQEITPGVYRVDMGVNYAGWFEMQLKGQPGDSIVFQFSERKRMFAVMAYTVFIKWALNGKELSAIVLII